MKKLLFLLFILPLFSFGQLKYFDEPISDTLSISELLDNISKSKEETYIVNNTYITCTKNDSLSKYFVKSSSGIVGVQFNSPKRIMFVKCQFPFRFSFVNSQISELYISHCISSRQGFSPSITFDNSKFDLFSFTSPSDTNKFVALYFSKSRIGSLHVMAENIDAIQIDSCRFFIPKGYENYYAKEHDFQHIRIEGSVYNVTIQNCYFNAKRSKQNTAVNLDRTKTNWIVLKNNDFQTLFMNGTMADIKFIFKDNSSLKKIFVGPNPFFKTSSNFSFKYFEGRKIHMRDPEDYLNTYSGDSTRQIADPLLYDDLISFYSQLCTIYKLRGDQKSYNACYVELKGIETKRLGLEYQADKTLGSWFNWRLNQFLHLFCDFGTNPVKSLIISMYVILCFGIYYFFTYSEWDKINREFVMKQHLRFMNYMESNKTLETMYIEGQQERLNMYDDYEKQIEKSKKNVPWFMRFSGQQLYKTSILKHKLITWFYRRIDILKGTWKDLSKMQKALRGPLILLGLFIYVFYLIGVKVINSTILSLNAFSTLGFGDIPVKGISRYVAIMEGFIGWFLLSIFSVTLISQIIQS